MKWRNQLVALLCLLAFAGLGVVYFQHWVVQKPFGIILFIGEGLTPGRLAATRVYAGEAEARLSIDSMSHLALLRNYSKDFATPDQAAAATALATGVKVNNRLISIDNDGKRLASIVELAKEKGRATGLVTDGELTGPTCAAFYAHTADPNDTDKIANEFVKSGKIDIAMGGGVARFLPRSKDGERQDEHDLLFDLRRNGFDIVSTRTELEAIPIWRRPKLFGGFSRTQLAFSNQVEQRGQQPSLAEMVRRAIELLQYNPNGYLLVVDGALMRKSAEENNGERTLGETAEMDRALSIARQYSGKQSTIVVCGDAGIGGMNLNGFPFRRDTGIAIIGLNSAGQPWITWAGGPNAKLSYGAVKAPDATASDQPGSEQLEPGAFYARSALPTVDDVIALGTGRGTETLRGSLDSTVIFNILRDQL